jgi:hypothetical protein
MVIVTVTGDSAVLRARLLSVQTTAGTTGHASLAYADVLPDGQAATAGTISLTDPMQRRPLQEFCCSITTNK